MFSIYSEVHPIGLLNENDSIFQEKHFYFLTGLKDFNFLPFGVYFKLFGFSQKLILTKHWKMHDSFSITKPPIRKPKLGLKIEAR